MQKTLLWNETDFSLLNQLLKDPNGQIVVPHVVNLLSKFQPDPTVNKAVVGSCWRNFLLFSVSLSISLSIYGTLLCLCAPADGSLQECL